MEDKKFEEDLEKYSKENQKVVYSGGISTCGVLGVVFVTLKLLGYINWSWWWVTTPFWAPVTVSIIAVIIFLTAIIPITYCVSNNKGIEETTSKEFDESTKNDSNFNTPQKSYTMTPEVISSEENKEDKPRKKRSNKRKSKKNVESNTTTETDTNK